MGIRGEKMQAEILAVLEQSDEPLSAYGVLDELRRTHAKIAPPTIYRALAALVEGGKVHRLESLNAYMACRCGVHSHAAVLSICDDCGSVEERVAPDIVKRLAGIVGTTGFAPVRHVIEVHGLCGICNDTEAAS